MKLELLWSALLLYLLLLSLLEILVELFELLASLLEERGQLVIVLSCLVVCGTKQKILIIATIRDLIE